MLFGTIAVKVLILMYVSAGDAGVKRLVDFTIHR